MEREDEDLENPLTDGLAREIEEEIAIYQYPYTLTIYTHTHTHIYCSVVTMQFVPTIAVNDRHATWTIPTSGRIPVKRSARASANNTLDTTVPEMPTGVETPIL